MGEGTKTTLLEEGLEGLADEGLVKRVATAAEGAPPEDRVRAGLEAVVEEVEPDPTAARLALHELRFDPVRLARIEAWLGGDPTRTTFGLGAAMQIADTELASPIPDLDRIAPELLHWLEGDW